MLCTAPAGAIHRISADIRNFPSENPAGFPRKTSDYPRALAEIFFVFGNNSEICVLNKDENLIFINL